MHTADLFRQELARQMFYEATPIRGILDVNYGFEDPTLQAAASDFRADLRRCEADQVLRIPLEQIACSIQF